MTRLKKLLSGYDLNQGCLDICGFTSFLFACIRCYPVEFIRFAMDLFDNGSGVLGGFKVSANEDLMNTTLADLLNENPDDSTKPMYPDFTDWILQTTFVASFRAQSGIKYNGKKDMDAEVSMQFNVLKDESKSINSCCKDFFDSIVVDRYPGQSLKVNDQLDKGYAVILVTPAKFFKPGATATHVTFLASTFEIFKQPHNGNQNADWVRCSVHSYGKREELQVPLTNAPTLGDGFSRIIFLKPAH